MPQSHRSAWLALVLSLLLFASGCLPGVPTVGTIPAKTFRLEEPDAKCERAALEDLRGPLWTAESRAALESRMQADEPTVASVLGCHIAVLDRCHAAGRALMEGPLAAQDLGGECDGATHLVRPVSKHRVELSPLSLGVRSLTGTYRGVLRQPGGPHELYDLTLYLAQDGARVTGVTRISTRGANDWGDLLLEGRVEGNVLFFADVDVLAEDIGWGLAWCAKGGYLVVDPRDGHLHGPATAPFCMPGTLDLRRVPDRPRILLPGRADAR